MYFQHIVFLYQLIYSVASRSGRAFVIGFVSFPKNNERFNLQLKFWKRYYVGTGSWNIHYRCFYYCSRPDARQI